MISTLGHGRQSLYRSYKENYRMNREDLERLCYVEESKQILLTEMMMFLKARGLWEEFQENSTVKISKKLVE